MPDPVSFEAAAMLEPMSVAAHTIRHTKWNKEDPILILGLGTIGFLVTMLLAEAGADNLYVVGNKEFQKEKILSLGIDESHYCGSNVTSVVTWLQEQTHLQGARVVFECVGKSETLSQAIDCTATKGSVITVGNPASDMSLPKTTYWNILRRELTLKGIWNSSFTGEETDDWHYVLSRLSKGTLHPEIMISHRLPLDQLRTGLEIMRDKKEPYGKVMTLL